MKYFAFIKNLYLKGLSASLLGIGFLVFSKASYAQGFNDRMTEVAGNLTFLPQFLTIIAYVAGIGFAIIGLLKLKEANEDPRVPIKIGVGRLLIGGFLLALGFTLDVIYGTVFNASSNPVGTPAGDPQFQTAATLGHIIENMAASTGFAPMLLTIICYVAAIYLTITALLMLMSYIEDPRQAPIGKIGFRLLGAALLLGFPRAINIVVESFGGDISENAVCWEDNGAGCGTNGTSWRTGMDPASYGDGLDGVLSRFVDNIAPPLMSFGLPAFCYMVGIIFIAIFLFRLAKGAAEDGPRAPGGMGTIITLAVGAFFLLMAGTMNQTIASLFGTSVISNDVQLVNSPLDSAMELRAENAMIAVLLFLRIVGYISFARGLFILRAFGEGQQSGSIMGAATHIIAGGMLANLGALLETIQATTNINIVTF